MPEIVDVIKTQTTWGFTQVSVVVDKMPRSIWRKIDQANLILEDDGFYKGLQYGAPTRSMKAFAGAEFDINLDDGTKIRATGQWWDCVPDVGEDVDLVSVGVATIEELNKCNVFFAFSMDKKKLDAWLEKNSPSSDRNKYRKSGL